MRKVCKDNPGFGLSFLYNNAIGRIILMPLVKSSFVSNIVGKYMDSFLSKIIIKPFIKSNNINMDDYKETKYKCFNDFFIRQIKEEKRPYDKRKNMFISPCDAKLTYYKINNNLKFKVKNSTYTLQSLINDNKMALKYKDGVLLVFRLSPDDYHRYIFTDDGIILNNYKINGFFNTVNPIVYDKYKVFKENTRECTFIKTNNFKDIIQIEVGALLVGKINNKVTSGVVSKGMEKGYFMYGGSTIIIVLEKDAVMLDKEIIDNSKKGYETCVKCGEKIGKKL